MSGLTRRPASSAQVSRSSTMLRPSAWTCASTATRAPMMAQTASPCPLPACPPVQPPSSVARVRQAASLASPPSFSIRQENGSTPALSASSSAKLSAAKTSGTAPPPRQAPVGKFVSTSPTSTDQSPTGYARPVPLSEGSERLRSSSVPPSSCPQLPPSRGPRATATRAAQLVSAPPGPSRAAIATWAGAPTGSWRMSSARLQVSCTGRPNSRETTAACRAASLVARRPKLPPTSVGKTVTASAGRSSAPTNCAARAAGACDPAQICARVPVTSAAADIGSGCR